MKKLSTAFQWVAWVVLAAAVICGFVFARNAEDGAWLIFVYWAIGGGLFFMFALAQSYVLGVAARADEKMHKEELEEIKQAKSRAAQPQKQSASTSPVKPITHDGNDYITCPICGCNQKSNMFCLECGAEFVRTQSKTIVKSTTEAPPKKVLNTPRAGYAICPQCGTEQRENRTVCYECGAPLSNSGEAANGKGNL